MQSNYAWNRFNSTPIGYLDTDNKSRNLKCIVEENEIPFHSDRSKLVNHAQKSMEGKLKTLLEIEIATPTPCDLLFDVHVQLNRNEIVRSKSILPIEELRKILSFASN